VVLEKLKTALEQIVEFLSLQIHLFLNYAHMLLVLLLVASDLTRTNHTDLRLQLSFKRVMLSQARIECGERIFDEDTIKFLCLSKYPRFLSTKLLKEVASKGVQLASDFFG
jgi:hypothetical protein